MKTFVLSKSYNEDTGYMWAGKGFLVAQNEEEEHSSPPS